ncbi:MAG: MGMT family protein [Bacillota bacterium]|nr:MGMT family protein [Bacillota bacterium]
MNQLYMDQIDTPKGVFLIVFSESGIYELLFPGSELDIEYPQRDNPWPELKDDLENYFKGEKVDWNRYPLDCSGYPPFFESVLEHVRQIPSGEVITYKKVAELAGSPKAARAAGQALKSNRHPIIVPCHRVVGSSGKLGGFSGPEGWKKMLLDLEKSGYGCL